MNLYKFLQQVASIGIGFVFSHIVIIIATFLLAVLAYRRNPRNLNNRSFALLNLSFSVFTLSMLLANLDFLPHSLALYFRRATWGIGFLVAFSLFNFFFIFPEQKKDRPWYYWLAIAVSLVLGPLAVTTGLVYKDFSLVNDVNKDVTGILFGPVVLSYALMTFGGAWMLFLKLRHLTGLKRVQVKYVFFGLFSFIVYIFLTDIIPILLGFPSLSEYGALGTIFIVVLPAYAIIKHRLMDIRLLALKSIAYSLTVGLIIGAYISIAYLITARFVENINILNIVFLVVLLIFYDPLKRFVDKYTDKLFFKGRYDFQEVIAEINDSIAQNSRSAKGLTAGITKVLLSNIKADKAVFYLSAEKSTAPELFELAVNKHESIVVDELENHKDRVILEKYGADVLVPVRTEERCEAILALGFKKSGDMYSEMDLDLLDTVAPPTAVALENARYYEQLKLEITKREKAKKIIQHKDIEIRQSYIDAFSAVTGGKLVLETKEELEQSLGKAVSASYDIDSYRDLSKARKIIRKTIEENFPCLDIDEVILASCEAITNSIKHAGSGHYQVLKTNNTAQIFISDSGPGIDFKSLPKATLLSGYSTKQTLGVGFNVMLDFCDKLLLATQSGGTEIILERSC